MPQCITVVEGEIVALVVSHSILQQQGTSETSNKFDFKHNIFNT
jgi:hypothetical protein